MYEMRIGTAATGSGLVWHVVGHDRSSALCGQPLREEDDETDLHCLSCMSMFQELMRHPGGA
ncbi:MULTISPECIES: hypothetical protein [Streptomyces]|uniref:Zinc-finger n=1 Tax=Streptomyces sudanensis TaxID=436397 RepID=A0ABY4TIL2_9ACTN|nr:MULTISPECIES: hypothetical protein [Streptomyces]MCP9956674.1 hypothetical protein [Streptomyces sudanensis]MCP9985884.1 hypothetical protein [Streptomyces sudanensis]MCQ0002725.1 hypothetical protein [Streptomyces sudanensis]URN17476.1 hypothetical protein MW084_17800 [Streptomyces sudanensis]